MKLSDIKEHIDKYFDSITPEDIIRKFENMGCEFENLNNLNNKNMNIKQTDGRLWINGKEVRKIIFTDKSKQKFPISDTGNNSSTIEGNGNVIIQGSKNVNTGKVICKGDFHIGDI